MSAVTHIDEALVKVLSADAGIATQAGSRIYQVQAPQGTAFPCIVFARETQLKDPFTDLLRSNLLIRATYTFSCISDNLLEVRNLARAVKAALQYVKTDRIRLAVVRSDDDQQELAPGGEQLPVYRTDLSVDVTYSES
jgi:hypothetical protein